MFTSVQLDKYVDELARGHIPQAGFITVLIYDYLETRQQLYECEKAIFEETNTNVNTMFPDTFEEWEKDN